MKREDTTRIILYGNQLILRESLRGWAVIVPDQLQIDNFYHDVHIHPDKVVLPIKDCETIFSIVVNHLEKEKRINQKKLRKELGL